MTFYQNCHLILTGQSEECGNMWLGDYNSARDRKKLKLKKIFHIITAGLGMKISYPNQFKHKVYPLYDSEQENISRFFQDSYSWIEDALKNGNILIHCFAGVSRSASIVIAYLMQKNQWDFKKAFNFVKKSRPYIGPNNGFMRQLREHQRALKKGEQNNLQQIAKISTVNKKQQKIPINFIDSVVQYKGKRGISFDPLKNYKKTKNNQRGVSNVRDIKI